MRAASPGMSGAENREREPADEGVFQWGNSYRTWTLLGSFLFFSVLIHGAGFYLFQVVYPTPLRVEPRQGRITFLDPSDPSVRSLLQRVEDRTIYLRPASEGGAGKVRLGDVPIPFTPAFEEERISLRPPEFEWSLPFSGGSLATNAGRDLENLPRMVSLRPEVGLAEREVAPWSLLLDYLGRAEWFPELRLRISVDRDGKVEVLEVGGELEPEDRNELVAIFESTLRFRPGPDVDTGWIRVFPER